MKCPASFKLMVDSDHQLFLSFEPPTQRMVLYFFK
jgi:hypothetical protein